MDWELIIVDDGSTDDTRKLVGGYHDSRIRYVWQENQERSAARNHGIRLAQGEWVCFLDSDDEYLPEHLEILYSSINVWKDYCVFRTASILVWNGQKHFCNHSSLGKYDNFPYDSFHSFAFAKSVLKEFLFDERYFIGEDFHFLLRVGQKYSFFIIQKHTVLIHHNPHNSGGVGLRYASNIKNGKECFDDMLSWHKGTILPYLRRKRCLFDILLIVGHFKNMQIALPQALLENVKVFSRFPIEYFLLLSRLFFVKWGEWTGWYKCKYRF